MLRIVHSERRKREQGQVPKQELKPFILDESSKAIFALLGIALAEDEQKVIELLAHHNYYIPTTVGGEKLVSIIIDRLFSGTDAFRNDLSAFLTNYLPPNSFDEGEDNFAMSAIAGAVDSLAGLTSQIVGQKQAQKQAKQQAQQQTIASIYAYKTEKEKAKHRSGTKGGSGLGIILGILGISALIGFGYYQFVYKKQNPTPAVLTA